MHLTSLLLVPALLLAAGRAAAQDPPPLPADTGRVYALAEVQELPVPTNPDALHAALAAGYPPALRDAGTGGTVMLSFMIGADGAVREPRVVSSSDAAFDAPSMAAVGVLRFTPGTVGGRAVATRVEIPVQWQAPPPADRASGSPGGGADAAAEGGTRVYEMKEVDERPRPRNMHGLRRDLERAYPGELRDAAVSGMVHVRFRLDREGVPRDIRVTRTTDRRFNQPTVESVGRLRFSPAQVDGRLVEVWIDLPVQWSAQR